MLLYASLTFFGTVNLTPIKENLWLKLPPAFMSCTAEYFPDFQLPSSGNYSEVYKDCDKFFRQTKRLPRKGNMLKQIHGDYKSWGFPVWRSEGFNDIL